MRIKLTLRRPEGESANLAVTADATATVGDLARAVAEGDPGRKGAVVPERLTLQVSDLASSASGEGRVLDPSSDLLSAGIRSGSTVSLTQLGVSFASPQEGRGPAAAVLRVLSGPDAGREFSLPAGTSRVGRDRDMDVRLSDPLVSKRHARVVVGSGVEITDTNSANGILVGGMRVSRATLTPADTVVLGDTTISVVSLQRVANLPASSPVIEFNRSPRVVRRPPVREIPAPTPPERPNPGRFPLVAMVAPLVMGAVLWFATRQLLSLVFVGLSPLLMIGSWLDQKITARRVFRAQTEQFAASMEAAEGEIERAHTLERAIRLSMHPSVADAVDAVERLSPLLWTRRPEHREFLSLRLGLGKGRAHTRVRLSGSNSTLPEFWHQLEELEQRASVVDGVPVVADLREAGGVGVAGTREDASAVARGLVLQLAAFHAPGDVVVAALTSPSSRSAWDWLEWLPHTWPQRSPLGGEHLADNPGTGGRLLERLEGLVEERLASRTDATVRGPIDGEAEIPEPVLPSVLVVVEDDVPLPRPRLTRLAERGPDAGVHVVWVAPDVAALPAACRTFLTVGGVAGTSGEVRTGDLRHPVVVEHLPMESAVRLARSLAPIVDAGAMTDDETDLPRSISYVTLVGPALLEEPTAVAERWHQTGSVVARDGTPPVRRKSDATLHAVVGSAGAEPLALDLRAHGPHALVGGTTGSGKSEFLQSWVLGMATAHSPDRLTFLFVDYKGGTAFADCVDLPHCVGLVTDLSTHLVRRALTSLRAEIRYREHLLNRKKAKDLVSLERTGDPECPPSLLIVVDEFAALAQEIPEFVDGVVDVAQRGRSLGLHLILATQRPAGVIKDNLRANTNLRIALRMADAEDSADILGSSLAAHFDPAIPGRGAVKTGPGRISVFQAGYAGGTTSTEPEPVALQVLEMDFGSATEWEMPQDDSGVEPEPGPTDISRIVRTVRRASRELAIPVPRRPWLPELPATYDFALLPNPRTDERLLLGVMDDPSTQSQPTLVYEPDRDGNMAIFGTGGSGKSATLRALAVASAVTPRGGPVQVYGLDFGASGLKPIEVLPHVGAVVDGDDEEGVGRVLRMLRDLVDDRATRYAAVRAGSIGDYRTRANAAAEPRILLLVDGVTPFREAHEFAPSNLFGAFAQIAVDGRQVGVHVVMTADRPNAVPMSIASTVQRRLVLRMASEDDYLLLGVPKDILGPSSPPGRGVIDGNEFQVAMLGGNSNLAVQGRELAQLAESMTRHGTTAAPSIGRLPSQVLLGELPATDARGALVIGVDDETLGTAAIDPWGPLLVSGPPASGRTTALLTIAAAVRRARGGAMIAHLAPRRTSLAGNRAFDTSLTSPDQVAESADGLVSSLEAGRIAPGQLALMVESLTEFSGTVAEGPLVRLVQAAIRAEQLVVGESESSTWNSAYQLAPPFKAGRRGLLLVPGEMEGDNLLGTPLGRFRRADLPPGRGFLVAGGRARKLQVAMPG